MKNHIFYLLRLVIVSLSIFPAVVLAVPPATSPYNTDEVNSYVHDQTSQVMSQLNNILCFMGAMAPDQMVNLTTNSGNYIALVDKNTCESGRGGSGGQSSNTGPAYASAVVNSSRASNTANMLVKVWVTPEAGNDITAYAIATQAPSATLPYGVFRMDYCGGTNCAVDKGFINATSSGLSFYSTGTRGADSETTALLLNATSTTAGNGAINASHTWGGVPGVNNFLFAYNASYFVRSDGGGDVCFDRSPANADESVWRYGLYDATTGAQITRKSGFPIEYTDTGTGVTSNGYIGYHGLHMPVTVLSGATVQQVTYGPSGPTKTAYTLLKTGGKLSKYTTAIKTLADLNKVTFWYFAQNAVGTAMLAGSQYELYWDDSVGAKKFFVSGMQNPTSNNMEPLVGGPVAVANAAMIAANPWGLFGWSQMMGGQFGIKGNDFATLSSTTPVLTQIQDIVYPSQYTAIGNLRCINDCPTAISIAGGGYVNQGWNAVAASAFETYTLDATTGNLIDGVTTPVVSTATTGNLANGVRSGRMVTVADAATMITNKELSGVCGGVTTAGACTSFGYNQGDVDFLPAGSSYYVWETGANSWNQLAILMSQTVTPAPVVFDPPLSVNFVVPTGAKYGSYQGATIRLEYGGSGDLWGIPNECVDVTTNAACDFAVTLQQNQRWTSKFSIPTNTTDGAVTVATTQGAVTQGTQYLVKALDKEVRLAKVLCTGTGLSTAGLSNAGLPVAASFNDPTATVGAKPTFATMPAPQVIHGVKQY